MGTAAVFAVASSTKGKYYTKILGRTMDGFPGNLEWCACLFAETARSMQCLTQVRKNNARYVEKVLSAIAADENLGWFMDNVNNASWVNYSAIYNPKTGELKLYRGLFEYLLSSKTIDVGKAKTADRKGERAGKLARITTQEKLQIRDKALQKIEKAKKKAEQEAKARLSKTERLVLGV